MLELKGLATKICELTFEAEDIIDSYVVTQLQQRSLDYHPVDVLASSFYKDIDKVIQNLMSFKKDLSLAKAEWGEAKVIKLSQESTLASSSATSFGEMDLKVGLDRVDKIITEVTSDRSDLQIIPIIGMGGIGKTTLAKAVFEDQYIVSRFDRRLWVTVSQDHNILRILSSLLKDGGKTGDVAILGDKLYKELFNRRYLIVMDDMWSIDAWQDLKRWLPNNHNQSRIVITSRISSLHNPSNSYFMTFLDKDSSWRLFCQTIFGKDCCPYPELEEVGTRITKSCRGLPIEIVIVGRLLAKSDMTREYWEHVAENVDSFGNLEDEEHCLKILSLSYKDLPIHLKSCYLHMRKIPGNARIMVSRLVVELVHEGFIKQIGDKSLEEIAYDYIKELVDRNMIFTRGSTSRGRIKSVGIHDLLRDLSQREFEKEDFHCFPTVQRKVNLGYRREVCCICSVPSSSRKGMVNIPSIILTSHFASQVGAFVCVSCKTRYPYITQLKLVLGMNTKNTDFFHATTLRKISFVCDVFPFKPFPTFHLLWNLQTLDIFGEYLKRQVLPSDLWEMPQLRHIKVRKGILPDPTGKQFIVLRNLQSLANVENFDCSEEVIGRIPNIKELHLTRPKNSLCNIAKLRKLESLTLVKQILCSEHIALPASLTKLKLSRCKIPWEDMRFIGSLPNLEVLQLSCKAFVGREWNLIEGEFLRLKVLSINSIELESWEADCSHFPNLIKLKLCHMHNLEEISSGIGDIPTLQIIELNDCKKSSVDSAKQILKEQCCLGNDSLLVVIDLEEWSCNQVDDDEGEGNSDGHYKYPLFNFREGDDSSGSEEDDHDCYEDIDFYENDGDVGYDGWLWELKYVPSMFLRSWKHGIKLKKQYGY